MRSRVGWVRWRGPLATAPPEAFEVSNVLGSQVGPWLIGAAAAIAIIPPPGLAALVLKALKLPQPRDWRLHRKVR